jgi:hypothetical protein
MAEAASYFTKSEISLKSKERLYLGTKRATSYSLKDYVAVIIAEKLNSRKEFLIFV